MSSEEFYDAVFEEAEPFDIDGHTLNTEALRSAPLCWPEIKVEAFLDRLHAFNAAFAEDVVGCSGFLKIFVDTLTEAFDEIEEEHIAVIGEVSRHNRTCVPAEFCFCPGFDPALRRRRWARAVRQLLELQNASVDRLSGEADEPDQPDQPDHPDQPGF